MDMQTAYMSLKEFDREAPSSLAKLRMIMQLLRHPQEGCPWDIEQDFTTIIPHTIEEAYEVADAIAAGNTENLCEELGDLLLQVIYHCQMAQELNLFDIDDVIDGICRKLIRRHPHIFASHTDKKIKTAQEQTHHWESLKLQEKKQQEKKQQEKKQQKKKQQEKQQEKQKEDKNTPSSILDSVSSSLPAMMQAQDLQKCAAKVGFDWQEAISALDKVEEEIGELRDIITQSQNASSELIEEEIGDVLFSTVNLARKMTYDAETLLRKANHKFKKRFLYIEERLMHRGRPLEEASLEEMETLWQESKYQESKSQEARSQE